MENMVQEDQVDSTFDPVINTSLSCGLVFWTSSEKSTLGLRGNREGSSFGLLSSGLDCYLQVWTYIFRSQSSEFLKGKFLNIASWVSFCFSGTLSPCRFVREVFFYRHHPQLKLAQLIENNQIVSNAILKSELERLRKNTFHLG